MDTFNHVPANDYSSQNTIIIFKSCLELNFCQAGTSLAVDEGCNGFFFFPPLPQWRSVRRDIYPFGKVVCFIRIITRCV